MAQFKEIHCTINGKPVVTPKEELERLQEE